MHDASTHAMSANVLSRITGSRLQARRLRHRANTYETWKSKQLRQVLAQPSQSTGSIACRRPKAPAHPAATGPYVHACMGSAWHCCHTGACTIRTGKLLLYVDPRTCRLPKLLVVLLDRCVVYVAAVAHQLVNFRDNLVSFRWMPQMTWSFVCYSSDSPK